MPTCWAEALSNPLPHVSQFNAGSPRLPSSHSLVSAPRFGTQARALIVDGHGTARHILASHLRRLGVAQVQQCARAAEAVQQLQTREFDLLLCEYRLADGSLGQELIEALRRRDLLPLSTVVVMMSTEATHDVVAEVAEAALDGFIVKPYSPGDLEQRLLRATRRKQALRPVLDAVDEGRDAEALRLCEERLKARSPHWAAAARVGAELALRHERPALAASFYEAVLADRPLPWARLGVARALDASEKKAEAAAAIEAFLAAEPSYADAYDVLGRLHAELGDFRAALNACAKAREITPASVQRAQMHGIVAHHAGAHDVALAALERAAGLGVGAASVDPQVQVLLALMRFRRGEAAALRACRDTLDTALARLPRTPAGPERLARFAQLVQMLDAACDGEAQVASDAAARAATSIGTPGFDFEAGLNLLAVLALLRSTGLTLRHDDGWVRRIGLRFCTSRQATELMVRAVESHPEHGELLRAAHAEMGDVAERALGDGLAGEHGRGVEQLLDAVETTHNAKLWKLASATLSRHEQRIAGHAALRERCDALRDACGSARIGQWLADTGARPPGGLALGPWRNGQPRRPAPPASAPG